MPDPITPQERAAIDRYTGPITIIPPARAMGDCLDPVPLKDAANIKVRSIWRGRRLKEADN